MSVVVSADRRTAQASKVHERAEPENGVAVYEDRDDARHPKERGGE